MLRNYPHGEDPVGDDRGSQVGFFEAGSPPGEDGINVAKFAAEPSGFVLQLSIAHTSRDLDALLSQNIACIHAFIHKMNGDASFL